MIPRYFSKLDEHFRQGRVLVVFGARRVGKTTLLKKYLSETAFKYKLDSGENIVTQNILGSQDFKKIFEYAEGYELLVIDEAQQIPNIGQGLKILIDHLPELKIIVSGSASFDLAQKIGEPLTGRKTIINLLPIAQSELARQHNKSELQQYLNDYLIFGCYPEVLITTTQSGKKEILTELTNSYLLKDILVLDKIKDSRTIIDLLKLLAFQLGNLVSFNELAVQLRINVRTVERYIDLLEKTFVIHRLTPLSRNLRNEISAKNKFYFYDNGVRNSLIMNFNEINSRNDLGAIWENFMINEFFKKNTFSNPFINKYFWKNYNQVEVDYIEEQNGFFDAYEFKWTKAKNKFPVDFLEHYKPKAIHVINKENYLDFLL